MMSKFKQLRLRLVVAVAVLLMAGTGTEAFAQCYTKNLQQAESLYKQGRYADLLSTGNCKIINLSEENILWGFKI